MTNSEWVMLHILWKSVSSHLFLWPTASQWHCKFCERQPHHILSYDQQAVSDIAHYVNNSLITSLPMTNSLWVTLHILWKVVLSHIFLWPTASEWHYMFCERQLQSHHIFSYDSQQQVSDVAHSVKDSHHIFSYDQQEVSDIVHFVKGSLIYLFLWPTGSKWHCTFCERQSYHFSYYDQQAVSDSDRQSHHIFSYDQ